MQLLCMYIYNYFVYMYLLNVHVYTLYMCLCSIYTQKERHGEKEWEIIPYHTSSNHSQMVAVTCVAPKKSDNSLYIYIIHNF